MSKIRAGVTMVDWLNKWQNWLQKPFRTSGVEAQPDPRFWNLSHHPPLVWEAAEMDLLRDCERRTTLCTVTQELTGTIQQTAVLSFECETQQILLDEFFPVRQRPLPGQKFQLSLPTRSGLLVLDVRARDSIWIAGNPAYVMDVLDKKRLSDRRVHTRVTFEGHGSPGVDLLLPLTPALRGQLLDLSSRGCAINCFSPHKPPIYSRKGQCRIHFSDTFVMTADLQVTHVSFQRQPCRHTLFRARFQPLPLNAQEQLLAFIHSYQSLDTKTH